VLIIDDVAEDRALAVNLLVPLGFDTVEAGNGLDALERAQSMPPDLILMDNALSGMDGRETILRLRQWSARLPIVVMSANAASGNAAEYANAVIPKPIAQDSLLVHIAALLNLEWIFTPPPQSASITDESAEPLIFPPTEEMQTLHRLAQLGNMRDILRYAERVAGLDPRYGLFAAQLRRFAEGYQSKAILAFAEQHLNDAPYESSH